MFELPMSVLSCNLCQSLSPEVRSLGSGASGGAIACAESRRGSGLAVNRDEPPGEERERLPARRTLTHRTKLAPAAYQSSLLALVISNHGLVGAGALGLAAVGVAGVEPAVSAADGLARCLHAIGVLGGGGGGYALGD